MGEFLEFWSGLFSTELWPARWNCGQWSSFHGWLFIISDIFIWLAYFLIPLVILSFVDHSKGLRYRPVFYWFCAFITLCGFSHMLDAIIFWFPMYRFAAVIRFLTAITSIITVYVLVKEMPKIVKDLVQQSEGESQGELKAKVLTLEDELTEAYKVISHLRDQNK